MDTYAKVLFFSVLIQHIFHVLVFSWLELSASAWLGTNLDCYLRFIFQSFRGRNHWDLQIWSCPYYCGYDIGNFPASPAPFSSSPGRGSDSESDLPHRKLPDVKKDDMSARRTSHGEPKSAVPFNQYLPNKSNQTAYVPAPLRKKKAEREEYRKSWSTATSPLGGERPFR